MRKPDLVKKISSSLLQIDFDQSSESQLFSNKIIASVLVILHYRNRFPNIVLTKRTSHLVNHQNEISFPGGKFVKSDYLLINTAIRETYEEVGLSIKSTDIIGRLQTVYTLTSNFLIIPYVTVQDEITVDSKFINEEVAEIIDVPLFDLFDTMQRDRVHDTKDFQSFTFSFEGHIVWGATARIINQLYQIFNQNTIK